MLSRFQMLAENMVLVSVRADFKIIRAYHFETVTSIES